MVSTDPVAASRGCGREAGPEAVPVTVPGASETEPESAEPVVSVAAWAAFAPAGTPERVSSAPAEVAPAEGTNHRAARRVVAPRAVSSGRRADTVRSPLWQQRIGRVR